MQGIQSLSLALFPSLPLSVYPTSSYSSYAGLTSTNANKRKKYFDEGMDTFPLLFSLPQDEEDEHLLANTYPSILLFNFGVLLSKLHLYDEALDFLEQARMTASSTPTNPDLQMAILHHLGRMYFRQKKYNSSLKYYQRALILSKDVYGPRHEHVASSLNCVGVLFSHAMSSGHQKVIAAFQQALDIQTQLGKENDLATLTIRHNIARCLMMNGDFHDAMVLLQEVHDARVKWLPETHMDVLVTHLHSALAHESLCEYSKAIDLYRQFLHAFIPIYGVDHEYVEQAEEHIADIYVHEKMTQKAFDAYFVVLRTSMAVRGHYNLKTADILHKIGLVCNQLEDFDGALASFQEELSILRRCNLGNDVRIVRALHDIGRSYNDLGSKANALSYYQESLCMQQQLVPRVLLDEAYTHSIIGLLLFQMGRSQEAKQCHHKAMELKVSQLGPDHYQISYVWYALGSIYMKEKEIRLALEAFHKCLAIRRASNETTQEDLIEVLNQIAFLSFENGNWVDSDSFYQEALALIQSMKIPDKNTLIRTLYHISSVQKRLGNFDNSLHFGKEALRVVEDSNADLSFTVDKEIFSRLLKLLGSIYLQKGDMVQAHALIERAHSYSDDTSEEDYVMAMPLQSKPMVARAA